MSFFLPDFSFVGVLITDVKSSGVRDKFPTTILVEVEKEKPLVEVCGGYNCPVDIAIQIDVGSCSAKPPILSLCLRRVGVLVQEFGITIVNFL